MNRNQNCKYVSVTRYRASFERWVDNGRSFATMRLEVSTSSERLKLADCIPPRARAILEKVVAPEPI